MTLSDVLDDAAMLISARGLARYDFESPFGELDVAGAVAVAVGLPATIWVSHSGWDLETPAYQTGFRVMWVMIESRGYDMHDDGEPWDGERLAEHLAFLVEDERPSVAEVLDWLREVADHYQEVAA